MIEGDGTEQFPLSFFLSLSLALIEERKKRKENGWF
jgi:hypothetical protein